MILSFILYFFLLIILLIVLLISIPYRYYLTYSYDNNFNYKIIINALIFQFTLLKENDIKKSFVKIFGFKKDINNLTKNNVIKDKIESKVKDTIKKDKDKDKKKKKKKDFSFPIKIISKDNILHIINFIKDIIKNIIPKKIQIFLQIGTDEPHINGYILAYYYTLKGIYPKIPINIDICWQEEVFKSNGKVYGYIIPAKIMIRILTFIFSITTIKTGWEIYKYKKDKKKNLKKKG